MSQKITRRNFLGFGALMGGTLFGSCFINERPLLAKTADAGWPWPYRALNLRQVEQRGYVSGDVGGCMYAAFDAIVGSLADHYGKPYSTFPRDMMRYGGGGMGGMGTVCGALNGAAATIGLFVDKKAVRNAMIQELCLWYERTSLPIMTAERPVHAITMLPSVAGSPLCHISLTNWCEKSGYKVGTPAHMERCNLLSGDVARKTADILNEFMRGKFKPSLTLSADMQTCMECHGVGGEEGNSYGKMECGTCHTAPHPQN